MVSERTVERLSLYRRILLQLRTEGSKSILSHELAALARVNAPQVRRDVMQLGYSGIPNSGYDVGALLTAVNEFLDAPEYQKVALVGVGNLGQALLQHFSGRWRRLSIRAAFDKDPAKAGRILSGCPCFAMSELPRRVQEFGISLGIIAVPPDEAQTVADVLCFAGVLGLVNFAPVRLRVPDHVFVENVDLTSTLEKVAFFARRREAPSREQAAGGEG